MGQAPLWARIAMQLLASREYPVIDYQTMAEFIGHERLLRMANGQFLLHMSSEGRLEAEERIIWLSVRDAISWLNEAPEHFGSFWEFEQCDQVHRRQPDHVGQRSISGD